MQPNEHIGNEYDAMVGSQSANKSTCFSMTNLKTHTLNYRPTVAVDSFYDDTKGLKYLVDDYTTGHHRIYDKKNTALDVAQALHNRACKVHNRPGCKVHNRLGKAN